MDFIIIITFACKAKLYGEMSGMLGFIVRLIGRRHMQLLASTQNMKATDSSEIVPF
jgi:hypothetical protein